VTRRIGLLVVCVGSILSVVACTGGTSATESTSDSIAFTANRDGFGEIWVMDADGGNRLQLTESSEPGVDASGSGSPAWSPDRTQIAYPSSGDAVAEDPQDEEIYVMRSDGSEKRRLTNDRIADGSPAWSPDGERIAFAHTPGSGSEEAKGVIVVMNADGSSRVEITDHSGTEDIVYDSLPDWSPDGSLIAFTRARFVRTGEASGDIYTIDPAGDGERLLIENAAEPAWSPDGSRIAFASARDRFGETCFHDCSLSGEIYVADADGMGARRLTRSEASDSSPAWSPDGRSIAFTSDRSNRAKHEYEIYVMPADGDDVRRLTTSDVWDLSPAWR